MILITRFGIIGAVNNPWKRGKIRGRLAESRKHTSLPRNQEILSEAFLAIYLKNLALLGQNL